MALFSLPTPQTLALPRAATLAELFGHWAWAEILLELALIGILALLAYSFLRVFNDFVARVYRGRGRWRAGALRIAPLVRFSILAVLAVAIGSILFELSTPVLVISLIALAIALGVGSVELMRNVLSGAVIGLQRPFKVSDHVQVGKLEGDVLRIGIRSTSLRATDGSIVHVPNHHFIADVVVNSSLPDIGTPTKLIIPLPAHADVARAKDIAFRAACISKFSSPRRRPQVRVMHNVHSLSSASGAEPPLALEVLVYTFSARHEDDLRGEVIELVNEGLAALQRPRSHDEPTRAGVPRLSLPGVSNDDDDKPQQ